MILWPESEMPSRFRGCIDLHSGQVKQIVGSSLADSQESPGLHKPPFPTQHAVTNHVSPLPAAHFAALYKANNVAGSHLIKLGPGNDSAAIDALAAWPHALQIGGGVTAENASEWISTHAAGAVIVTSCLFPQKSFCPDTLRRLSEKLDSRDQLVVDFSCTPGAQAGEYRVCIDRWKTVTDLVLDPSSIDLVAEYSGELLVHAAHVEGMQKGVDQALVLLLASCCSGKFACTYAGGAKELSDIQLVNDLSGGNVDLTYGSALDIFGGSGVKFHDLVQWNLNVSK